MLIRGGAGMGVDRAKIRWNGWGWAAHKDEFAQRDDLWKWLASELGMPALLATPARPLEELELPGGKLPLPDREALNAIAGAENVRDSAYERAFHALGRSYHDLLRLRAGDLSTAPAAVVYPRGADEVLAVLAFAARERIAVVPFGGGTSVVGGVTGARGPFQTAIALDLSAMDRMIEVDAVSGTATAEAGINGPALEKALQAKGLTLGHIPQSFEFSTLGGWIAHRGAGQLSNRYGCAGDWLVAAKLATPRGMLSTGDFPASAAGPHLADLVAGSEGIFGVITEATVRVRPVPAMNEYRGYLFRDFPSGTAAVRTAARDGNGAAMLRLADAEETRLLRAFGALGKVRRAADKLADAYLKLRGCADRPCLLIGAFEDPVSRRSFAAIARRFGAVDLSTAAGERWRRTRFQLPYLRDSLLDRGVGVAKVETASSWAKIDALYAATRAAIDAAIRETVPREGARGMVMCHIGHSYPTGACLGFTFVFPRALDGDIAQWSKIKTAASEAIVANGGTISHHLGVGEDHLPWIAQEKGALGIDVLRAIKAALDPEGILNPGKLLPPGPPEDG